MGRVVRDWKREDVEGCEVAPHRYLHSGALRPDGTLAKDIDLCADRAERMQNLSYLPGDVVYVQWGKSFRKARILYVMWSSDSAGFRTIFYRVQYATKAGYWSKLWNDAHPGWIQRGYRNAGLAPDYVD